MREFFNGWRRKGGCGLLVIAVVMALAWARSVNRFDYLLISSSFIRREFSFGSLNGEFALAIGNAGPASTWYWESFDTKKGRTTLRHLFEIWSDEAYDENPTRWLIDYPTAILLITLLSAYLILWKPRPKTKEQTNA